MSNTNTFCLDSPDGLEIFVHRWLAGKPRGIVQIVHGAAEHGARYQRFAADLNDSGFHVYAADNRGHGRTASDPGELGYFGDTDGWTHVLADIARLNEFIRTDHPGLPVILMGHSLGGLMTQHYLIEHADSVDAAILSGPVVIDVFEPMEPMVQQECDRLGPRAISEPMMAEFAQSFNQGIENPQTEFDWLSRDPAEVQAYIDDPLCGFPLLLGTWLDIIRNGRVTRSPEALNKIPPDLPLYLFAGKMDPVTAQLEIMHLLLDRYRKAGLENLSFTFYPEGRHELLNDIEREQVTADLLAWLNKQVTAG